MLSKKDIDIINYITDELDSTAEVKKNKDGNIIILEVNKKIIKEDNINSINKKK